MERKVMTKLQSYKSLYEKGIYLVNHLLDKGRLRSIEHFRNLGVNSEEAFIILEIYIIR